MKISDNVTLDNGNVMPWIRVLIRFCNLQDGSLFGVGHLFESGDDIIILDLQVIYKYKA